MFLNIHTPHFQIPSTHGRVRRVASLGRAWARPRHLQHVVERFGYGARTERVISRASATGTWTPGPHIDPDNPASLRVLKPPSTGNEGKQRLLVYLPGTDGTGLSILPQVERLEAAGYSVWCLYIPSTNRQGWAALAADLATLIRELMRGSRARDGSAPRQVTVVGESFGGCLALQLALDVPDIVEGMVLVNPATCYTSSLIGLPALASSTNLLGFFPEPLYNTAQSILLPMLVDRSRVGRQGIDLIRSMILMEAPGSQQVAAGGTAWTLLSSLAFGPAGAANFRTNLMAAGGALDESLLRGIRTPTLLVSSARDRVFPSIEEGARLQRLLPCAQRVILPDSAHAALLELDVDLARIMRQAGFVPMLREGSTVAAQGAAGSLGSTSGTSGTSSINLVQLPDTPRLRVSAMSDSSSPIHSEGRRGERSVPSGGDMSADSRSHSHEDQASLYSTVADAGRSSSSGSSSSTVGGSGSPAGSMTNGGEVSQRPASGPQPSQRAGRQGATSAATTATAGAATAGAAITPAEDPFAKWAQRLQIWRELVSPVVLGAELLPTPNSSEFKRPMLFVGNHGKMGLYDTPLLVQELYLRGYRVRGLAHPGHWGGFMGTFFEQFGAVKASPMAAYRLLRAGEKVLLFPGGAREVSKRRGEEYTLLWQESPDFVRLAAKCGALIVPFAGVGADDAYDVIMDTNEIVDHPVWGPITRALVPVGDRTWREGDKTETERLEESFWPLTRIPGLGVPSIIPIPNLQRLYYKFGTPIDTSRLAARLQNPKEADRLYRAVRLTVEQLMQELLEYRSQDEDAQAGPRLRKAVSSVWPLLDSLALPMED